MGASSSIDEVDNIEVKDNVGSNVIHGGPGGTAIADLTTSTLNVPTSAGNAISGYALEVLSNDANDILLSLDGGTTFMLIEMRKGVFVSSNVKGAITQIKLKSTASTIDDANYQMIIDFEDA